MKKKLILSLMLTSSTLFAKPLQERTYATSCTVQATNMKTLKRLAKEEGFYEFGIFISSYRLSTIGQGFKTGFLLKLKDEGKDNKMLLLYAAKSFDAMELLTSVSFGARMGMKLLALNETCFKTITSTELVLALETAAGKKDGDLIKYSTFEFGI